MDADSKSKNLSIDSLLEEQGSSLSTLYKKAKSIKEIDGKLKKLLDQSLKDKFELANINNNSAILLVCSSAWATRLRYNIPAILDALNNQLNFTAVKTIRIKIKKHSYEKPVINSKPAYLSSSTAKFLNEAANNFTDPELRECILNISKNHL